MGYIPLTEIQKKFQKIEKFFRKWISLKYLSILENETEQLWNSLSRINGLVTGDKPNGGDIINDSFLWLYAKAKYCCLNKNFTQAPLMKNLI